MTVLYADRGSVDRDTVDSGATGAVEMLPPRVMQAGGGGWSLWPDARIIWQRAPVNPALLPAFRSPAVLVVTPPSIAHLEV